MDRQLQPVHLKARVHELEDEEVLELEALLEKSEAANQRLEELRVRPGSQLEYEYLEQAVQEWKKEKKIQPKKKEKPKTGMVTKVLKTVWPYCLIGSLVGLVGGMIYSIIPTEKESKAKDYLMEILNVNCNKDVTIERLHEVIKSNNNTGIDMKYGFQGVIDLSIREGFKGIEIEEDWMQNNYLEYNVTMSPETAYKLGEKFIPTKCTSTTIEIK